MRVRSSEWTSQVISCRRMKLVIFSDLDGSLLNHSDYSYSEARPALERVIRNQVPLIFVTSKTRPEVEVLHREMQIEEPFVVENGGPSPAGLWRSESIRLS